MVSRFQSLADEVVLAGENGTAPEQEAQPSGQKPKIANNEQMDFEGQQWVQEHPEEAKVGGM